MFLRPLIVHGYVVPAGRDEANSRMAADRYRLVNNVACEAKLNEDDVMMTQWRQVPYREQWLALRVHGGSRSWSRFTACFNNSDT